MHEVEKASAVEAAGLSRKKFLAGAAGAMVGAALVGAAPKAARAHTTDPNVTDEDILNYALTLEHLEYAFYRDGLKKFNAGDFQRVFTPRSKRARRNRKRLGRPNDFSGRQVHRYFEIIRDHEDEHVDTLTSVIEDPNGLNGDAVPELEYNFETTAFKNIRQFIAVAQFLENTGVSAYDGAIAHIEAAGLLTAGATIATVEARHASYLNLLNGAIPFPDSFDEPVAPQDICNAIIDDNGGFVVNHAATPYGPYTSLDAFCASLPDDTG